MQSISIEQTNKTPKVHFDVKRGILELTGISIPEDADSFYTPLLDLIDEYIESPQNKGTVIVFKLVYFNTSTSDYLMGILKKLKKLQNKQHPVTVEWYYEEEDEDMKELGNHFKIITELPFEFYAQEEIN